MGHGALGIGNTVNSQPFDSAQGGAVNSQQLTVNSQQLFLNLKFTDLEA